MANIKNVVLVEIDPSRPVPEVCAVIASILPYHPGSKESILRGIQDAIELELKGGKSNVKPVREHQRTDSDQK